KARGEEVIGGRLIRGGDLLRRRRAAGPPEFGRAEVPLEQAAGEVSLVSLSPLRASGPLCARCAGGSGGSGGSLEPTWPSWPARKLPGPEVALEQRTIDDLLGANAVCRQPECRVARATQRERERQARDKERG